MTRTLPIAAPIAMISPVLFAQPEARYDVVVANGAIVDGAGNPWFRGDVGIRDGRIAAIGSIFAMAKVAAQYGGYHGSHVGSEGYQLVEG